LPLDSLLDKASIVKSNFEKGAVMDLGLKGKRAIVTGGSRGIGRAICEALASDGASVATCARGVEALEQALDSFRSKGVTAFGAPLDVRDDDAVSAWFEASVAALGGVDIVISNVSTRIDQNSPDWWMGTFEADLMQHVRLQRLAEPHLENGGGGSIVFIASIASVLTTLPPMEEAYGAMKAGLINLVGQWANRLAPKNIRVNAVSPGPILFPGGFWDGVSKAAPAMFERAMQLPAMGRLGTDTEVACATVFLASPAASYITGTNLRIDGGAIKSANF
jgi:3-oxoacyl-[acyl-carrier protein] reductase